ncbi:MAG: hypothetical protein AAF653_18215, partial [Chloroflexota bacterium]
MGLSRRLQNQKGKSSDRSRESLDADLDALMGDAPASPPKAKSKPADDATTGVQDMLTDLIQLTPQEMTDADYQPPPKRVTPPHIAKLRKQLRPKLLATKDEADFWDRRDPEKQAIIEQRLGTVLDRMNIDLNDDEYII